MTLIKKTCSQAYSPIHLLEKHILLTMKFTFVLWVETKNTKYFVLWVISNLPAVTSKPLISQRHGRGSHGRVSSLIHGYVSVLTWQGSLGISLIFHSITLTQFSEISLCQNNISILRTLIFFLLLVQYYVSSKVEIHRLFLYQDILPVAMLYRYGSASCLSFTIEWLIFTPYHTKQTTSKSWEMYKQPTVFKFLA